MEGGEDGDVEEIHGWICWGLGTEDWGRVPGTTGMIGMTEHGRYW